jgi:hypothetical protein
MQKYYNVSSGFKRGQLVQVLPVNSREKYNGMIMYNEMEPVNRGVPRGDKTEHIYIKFTHQSVYDKLLTRGSPIMVNRELGSKYEKCVVCEITHVPETTLIRQLKVAKDDGDYMLYPIEFTITPNQIGSMLIWREAYTIVAKEYDTDSIEIYFEE